MSLLQRIAAVLATTLIGASLLAFQGDAFQDYGLGGDHPFPFPSDGHEKTEFVFGRLRFQGLGEGFGGYAGRWWAIDYPKADRMFVQALRRLTRLHTRSAEQVVDYGDGLFNYPWIYAGQVSHWTFTPSQAANMRDYLMRGGFLMIDDSHGDLEWRVVSAGLNAIFPDRAVEDLQDGDEIFHVLYDLDERPQIPGTRFLGGGRYPPGAKGNPKWRAIRDDQGRIMVAICHNTDVADAWEFADDPQYPEPLVSASYRLTINYIIYAMTH